MFGILIWEITWAINRLSKLMFPFEYFLIPYPWTNWKPMQKPKENQHLMWPSLSSQIANSKLLFQKPSVWGGFTRTAHRIISPTALQIQPVQPHTNSVWLSGEFRGPKQEKVGLQLCPFLTGSILKRLIWANVLNPIRTCLPQLHQIFVIGPTTCLDAAFKSSLELTHYEVDKGEGSQESGCRWCCINC